MWKTVPFTRLSTVSSHMACVNRRIKKGVENTVLERFEDISFSRYMLFGNTPQVSNSYIHSIFLVALSIHFPCWLWIARHGNWINTYGWPWKYRILLYIVLSPNYYFCVHFVAIKWPMLCQYSVQNICVYVNMLPVFDKKSKNYRLKKAAREQSLLLHRSVINLPCRRWLILQAK